MSVWLVLKPETELYDYIHGLFEGDRLPVITPFPCVVIQGEACYVIDAQGLSDAQIAGLAEPLYQKYKDDPEMSRNRARLEVAKGMPISHQCCKQIVAEDPRTKQMVEISASDDAITPLFWMHETSGKLREAVEGYIHYRADRNQPQPTEQHILLMRSYLKMWINAPAYDLVPGFEAEKAALRTLVEEIESIRDIDRWLDTAMEIGIDPL